VVGTECPGSADGFTHAISSLALVDRVRDRCCAFW
jgi:hypothetical protein